MLAAASGAALALSYLTPAASREGRIRREDLYFDAAILGASLSRFARIDQIVFAQTNGTNLVERHVFLGRQIEHDGIRPALAQLQVIVRGSGGVRVAFHGDEIALQRTGIGSQLIEHLLIFRGKLGAIV